MPGFFSFVFPGAEMSARGTYRPWHVFGGFAIFFLSTCTAQTGLLEKVSSISLDSFLFLILNVQDCLYTSQSIFKIIKLIII
jgi:cytochrome b-561